MTSRAPVEARLLRGTRWRLVAWSGGLTVAVLLVLGALIYLSVAGSLAAQSRAELERRALEVVPIIRMHQGSIVPADPISVPLDGPGVGISFLGTASGSLAFVVDPDGQVLGLQRVVESLGLPVEAGLEGAREGGTDVRESNVADRPVRVLSQPVDTPIGTFVIQVLQDLEAERSALGSLRTILLVGGLGVLAAALMLGWVYAGRALVPIRESMRRQREFAADAGHELRTPLAIVKAAVEDARRQPASVGAQGGPLDVIDRQADRLTELVDELLVFARIQAGTLELDRRPVRLDEAVVAAAERIAPLGRRRGIELEIEVVPADVIGDARRLEQLVAILLDNAIRHSPDGGGVVIRLTQRASGLELSVEDEGPGIPTDELDSLFDRFYRARTATTDGVGLGLAIARWIAEGHGGRIRAENRQKRGARFTVTLPDA